MCQRSRNSQKRQNLNGFSLLELLVVMIIMVMIVAVVTPQFSSALNQLEAQKETRYLAALLRQVRNDAISTARPRSVAFDQLTRSVSAGILAAPHIWPDKIEIQLAPTLITDAKWSSDRVVFLADGSSSGATLTLATAARHYTVDVDWLTGKVNISE